MVAFVLIGAPGCADRAPVASWPQPEPPSLARPLEETEPDPEPASEDASEEQGEPSAPEAEADSPASAPGSGTPASGA